MNDMKIMKRNPSIYRYGQKECCIIKSNGVVKWYSLIMLTNLRTGESYVSEYNDYFFDKEHTINNSINTRKNNYGGRMVSFLNYIFFDRENPLKSIEDISKEIGSEFLNKYSIGHLSDRRTRDGNTTTVAPDTVVKAKRSLTYFYYWLKYKKLNKLSNGSWIGKYNLKYISAEDFNWIPVHTKDGQTRTVIENIFAGVETYPKEAIWKLDNPSELIVYQLIEIARNYDPMIAFPIALQAFVGLRRSEVCQIWRGRLRFKIIMGTVQSFYVNLENEKLLRDDGIRTGELKRKRCQIAYEAFLPFVYKLYNEHMELLKQLGLDNDHFEAITFGNNGKAMTTKTYARRFDALIPKLIKQLGTMKNQSEAEAALQAAYDYDKIINQRMTPHALRHFFTEYLANHEKSAHIIAMYRGDLTLNVALKYLKQAESKRKEIRKIQDSFAISYEKLMKKKPGI